MNGDELREQWENRNQDHDDDDGNQETQWDDEPCSHEHDEECYDYQEFLVCDHGHCMNCGGCGCPGYCDDHQTYNLRFAETGGTDPEGANDADT